MRIVILAFLAAMAAPAFAADPNTTVTEADGTIRVYGNNGKEPWYLLDPKPASLKAALAEAKAFLGADNPGYQMGGSAYMCAPFKQVGLPCDYNTFGALSQFLTVNGKGMFPAAGKTNPYVLNDKGEPYDSLKKLRGPDDVYVGQAVQNEMLRAAVVRNAALFKHGDLSAADVRARWR